MTNPAWSPVLPAPRDPWFRLHPRTALAVAIALSAGVLSLTVFTGKPGDDYFFLYVFPVALIAITFGSRAGTVAGLSAVALVIGWVALRDVSLSAGGWGARVVPLVMLGLLLGRASDRQRQAEAERRQLEAGALLHQEAIEINDSLVQGMAAARWSLEAGQLEAGLKILDATLGEAQELVSDLIRRAGMSRHSGP
ncbi:hypothetical protein [Kribbella solani]|uniref:Histidine kinase n=1 Tax=Kribbella solani TaxID=236067 RepID=A0A841DP71_9ACTN|nr:hypothetical protein [Kribbella solani]MBB5978480.1 hypothetical protein [Kribbella solani]